MLRGGYRPTDPLYFLYVNDSGHVSFGRLFAPPKMRCGGLIGQFLFRMFLVF